MRSKAHIKGHPIHPMLIAFPIGFGVSAPLADLAGFVDGWERCWVFAGFCSVATVISGLVAAIPGLVDYLFVVPPNSSAKKRATYHMFVNVIALGIMAASWAFRNWETFEPEALAVALEFGSILFMSVGGWLGGTLVYRNQIGVDHRYAEAGKWREQYLDVDSDGYVTVDGAGDLKPDQMVLVHVDGRRIVLARKESGFVAFDDCCTHRGGSLAGGMMTCGTVMCPWHGSQFSVDDGSVKAGPAERPIAAYAVEESGGKVRIALRKQTKTTQSKKVG